MESIYAKLLKIKQETSEITSNPVLDRINLELIKSFEQNESYKSKIDVIKSNINGITYIFSEKHKAIFDAYNELVILEYLNEKLKVEIIPETQGVKTPDYKLWINDTDYIFSDLKTLHYFQGNLNYTEIQNNSADVKIETDKKVREQQSKIIFSESVSYLPFKKGNNRDYLNINVIIEDIINKAGNLLKIEQVNYEDKNGIFLIDTVHLYLPMDLELGLPIHNKLTYKEPLSGILWNVAFGTIGDLIYNGGEFEGKPNIKNRLKLNGILNDSNNPTFNKLRAIAFIVNTFSERKIIGFHRSDERDEQLIKVLNTICDFVNDEQNTFLNELTEANDNESQ